MKRTRQEIFDLAWNGLKAQGFRQSMTKELECRYRLRKLRCAIGHCIPDNAYRTDLEGQVVSSGAVLRAAGIAYTDATFATNLQLCHDGADSPSAMERRLAGFASFYSLHPVLTPGSLT